MIDLVAMADDGGCKRSTASFCCPSFLASVFKFEQQQFVLIQFREFRMTMVSSIKSNLVRGGHSFIILVSFIPWPLCKLCCPFVSAARWRSKSSWRWMAKMAWNELILILSWVRVMWFINPDINPVVTTMNEWNVSYQNLNLIVAVADVLVPLKGDDLLLWWWWLWWWWWWWQGRWTLVTLSTIIFLLLKCLGTVGIT